MPAITLVRRQYLEIKKQFPETIVFFRLGDFYETFDDDARLVSQVCQIVFTGREMSDGERIPLAGVPYHAVDNYLAHLIQAGHKFRAPVVIHHIPALKSRSSRFIAF